MIEFEDSGEGEVFIKKSGQHVGAARYELMRMREGDGLADTALDVHFDESAAYRALDQRELLVLRIRDGRCQDFYVSRFEWPGVFGVIATGPLYEPSIADYVHSRARWSGGAQGGSDSLS